MEEQELLDRQFGLELIFPHSDPLESDSEAMNKEIQSSQDETAESAVALTPRDDQATTTAMNDLALRHGPQQDKETLPLSEGSNLSTARQNPVPEPAPARSRKRKSPEPLELEIAPPSTHEAANRAATKTVSGQLSRPTDPLNGKRLQLTSLEHPSRDKFDFPDDDPTPKKLPPKPGQPTVQVQKKARGRPRKNIPETLPNKDSTVHRALRPKAAHRETSLPQDPHVGDTNQIVEQSSLSNLGEKSSKRSAPLAEAQEESSGENEHSDISKTHGQRRTQDDGALLSAQEDQDEASLSPTGDARVTRAPNDVTTGDESGHVPQLPDEANEENRFSESEDMASVIEEENSDDEPEFELFGGINCWNLVVERAREVGVSRRKGEVISRRRPKISTDPVKVLVTQVQHLASLYREVGSCSDRDPNHETLENQLCDSRKELDKAIDKISESSVSRHQPLQRRLIQDIYAHAIPSMVFMLREALNCRSPHYTRPNDIKSLQEVVDIQDMLIRLCEKARRWKAKPMTKAPIMNTVAKGILPYMRDLKDRYFGRELASRTELARHQLEEANYIESHKRACEQEKLRKEQHHQQVLERRRLIYEHFHQMPKARDSRPQQISHNISHNHDIPNAHRRSHSMTSDQWTQPQNEDLVYQLSSKDSRDLPPQERYLAILNTPSLQNKLPEHIRTRALYYKELLIEDMGPRDFLLSIE